MATFADFALLRAVQSYGGAEVLRARRILSNGEGPPVHLALLGDDVKVVQRVAAVAEACAAAAHEQVARIHEVGRFEGEGYAVADDVDGVDLGAILEHDRRKKVVPDVALSLAVAHQLAQLALELQDRGDVWAAAGGAGLSALFPAGLRLDGVVLRADGKISVRVLAGAGHDAARPTPFRAPELRRRLPSASSDVFLVTQVLRALLSCDASATSAPRLMGPAATLGGLLAAGLAASPDERMGLFILVERIAGALASAAPKMPASLVVTGALKREYLSLAEDAADTSAEPSLTSLASGLRARLGAVRASLQIVWPTERDAFSSEAPVASVASLASLASEASQENRTAVRRPFASQESVDPSGIGRVFTEEVDDAPTATLRAPPRRPQSAPAPDVAVLTEIIDEPTTQTRAFRGEQTAESNDPPWLASHDAALIEASGAPPPTPSEIEAGPTTETRATFADDDETEEPKTIRRPRS